MLAIFLLLLGLLIAKPVFAGEPPTLTSPTNNSIISSIPTFTWQAVSGSTGYNILIDDESTVTSPYAKTPYYPTNPSYSPQTLNPGTYYWKVKAKDSSGNWGSFSSIWSFTLQATPSSPSPTPTPTPTPSPTPSSTSSSSTSSSSFTISNVPSQINSNQSFNVLVSLSLPNNPNTTFYLKGAFKKADSSNYFGLTKVSGSWVKNGSTYSSQYPITTDSSGNWSGSLEVQPDNEDSGFTGTGGYIFKVGRYTSSGSGPTWSKESNINIVSTVSSDQGGTPTSTANTTSSTTNPSTPPSIVKSKIIASPQPKSYKQLVYQTATVAAATESASPSPIVEVKDQKQKSYFSWAGILMIASGTLVLAFVYLRSRNLTDAIFNLFRKRN